MGNEQSTNKGPKQNGTLPEKHGNGTVTATITPNGPEITVNGEAIVLQNDDPLPESPPAAEEVAVAVTVEPESPPAEAPVEPEPKDPEPIVQPEPVQSETKDPEPVVQKEEVKKSKAEKGSLFGKMFKKKDGSPAGGKSTQEKETLPEVQADVSPPVADPQPETANPQPEAPALTPEPQSVTTEEATAPEKDEKEEEKKEEEEKAAEATPDTEESSQPQETKQEGDPEKKSVMDFLKTLVTPTKTSKKETATPGATKDQSPETQPAAATNTAPVSEVPAAPKGMSIPPPPPPEPPKMEVKGEAAAKAAKASPKPAAKAAATQPQSSKVKAAKDTLGKLFRSKAAKMVAQDTQEAEETPAEEAQPVVEVQVEPPETAEEAPVPVVEEQKVDPSKTGTLEAAAKPELPPPAKDEKKSASKSPFVSLSFFKPKVAEPKKAAAAAPPAAPEAAQTVKAKEEPKAAAAKASDVVVDNKQAVASQAGEDPAKNPKKTEKRNSFQFFFKNLGQKRHSTDAGVQTEGTTVAQAAEKTK